MARLSIIMQQKSKKKLSKNFNPSTLSISHMGSRGEGVSTFFTEFNYIEKEYIFFIPFSLPKEIITVKPDHISSEGIRANIVEIINVSKERVEPKCKHFFRCGGCILQHWNFKHYSQWKFKKVEMPISLISKEVEIKLIITSPFKSRRHAKFVAKKTKANLLIGFNEYRSNFISEIDECIILDEKLVSLVKNIKEPLNKILQIGQTINIHANVLDLGIDLLIEGIENIPYTSLLAFNQRLMKKNVIRFNRTLKDKSNDLLFITEKASLSNALYSSYMLPPPGGFLQATKNGELIIIQSVLNGLEKLDNSIRICELYAGSGSITLPLLSKGFHVSAYEINNNAINAVNTAAKEQGFGNKVKAVVRNLKINPLTFLELNKFDVIIIDPPRTGAQSQFINIAKSKVPLVISISCNINSFIKDAKILFENDYELTWVQPIDQFLFTQHIELVGLFKLKAYSKNAD